MKDVVSRGVLIDVVDGDQDFYYRCGSADFLRMLPLYGVDDPDYSDQDFVACMAYQIEIVPLD